MKPPLAKCLTLFSFFAAGCGGGSPVPDQGLVDAAVAVDMARPADAARAPDLSMRADAAAGDAANPPADAGGPDAPMAPTMDERDPLKRCNGLDVANPIAIPGNAKWATGVVAFSSQYQDPDWAATQATGAPNTYPMAGDLKTAWASLEGDAGPEFITLAFNPPAVGSRVWVLETYNPDAASKVTITTMKGQTVIYQQAMPTAIGDCAFVLMAPTGTQDPISEVRIDLASDLVPSWNEIDAVGIVP